MAWHRCDKGTTPLPHTKAEVSTRGLGFCIEQILKIWDKQT